MTDLYTQHSILSCVVVAMVCHNTTSLLYIPTEVLSLYRHIGVGVGGVAAAVIVISVLRV